MDFSKVPSLKTNSSPLKIWFPKRKGSYSNHPFSGANCYTLGKGKSSSKPSFSGSMLIFEGVVSGRVSPCPWGKISPSFSWSEAECSWWGSRATCTGHLALGYHGSTRGIAPVSLRSTFVLCFACRDRVTPCHQSSAARQRWCLFTFGMTWREFWKIY